MSDTERDGLPIPEFDELPTGSLESRIRSLGEGDLQTLIDHETEHGNRTAVLQALKVRLDQVQSGAEPTGGDAGGGSMPEAAEGASGGSTVSPETSGPPVNPPAHGVPGNPGQPR